MNRQTLAWSVYAHALCEIDRLSVGLADVKYMYANEHAARIAAEAKLARVREQLVFCRRYAFGVDVIRSIEIAIEGES